MRGDVLRDRRRHETIDRLAGVDPLAHLRRGDLERRHSKNVTPAPSGASAREHLLAAGVLALGDRQPGQLDQRPRLAPHRQRAGHVGSDDERQLGLRIALH